MVIKKTKGFTLIELLVVIAIIAILAILIIAALNAARSRARDSRRKQDLKSVQTGVEVYLDSKDMVPQKADDPWTLNYTELADFKDAMEFKEELPHDPRCTTNTGTGINCTTYTDYGFGSIRQSNVYIIAARLENTKGSNCDYGNAGYGYKVGSAKYKCPGEAADTWQQKICPKP